MPRAPLTDDALADLMPSMTSGTIVSFNRRDLMRGGSVEASAQAIRDDRASLAPRGDAAMARSEAAMEGSPGALDDALFDDQVLAASLDVDTRRIGKEHVNPAEADTERLSRDGLPPALPAASAAELEAAREIERRERDKRRKPTDSFTLSPEFAQRVFESSAIEILDPQSGDHIAFVRGILHRDAAGQVVKLQCYLPRGSYLGSAGAKLEFRLGTERWKVRDGFYVTPRHGRGDEWMYLGYVI